MAVQHVKHVINWIQPPPYTAFNAAHFKFSSPRYVVIGYVWLPLSPFLPKRGGIGSFNCNNRPCLIRSINSLLNTLVLVGYKTFWSKTFYIMDFMFYNSRELIAYNTSQITITLLYACADTPHISDHYNVGVCVRSVQRVYSPVHSAVQLHRAYTLLLLLHCPGSVIYRWEMHITTRYWRQ